MLSAKEQVLEVLDQLPDDATLDQVQYQLAVRQQIAEGDADIEAGRVLSHEQVKERLSRWFAPSAHGWL
jgi:predicted transcriptional regulator